MDENTPVLTLNEGQQAAADGFFKFLMDPSQKELIISGAGGVGKTFVMGHMIDQVMPTYFDACELIGVRPIYRDVVMTATTNKAAAVLSEATSRPTQTIHSYLNLTVKENFKTGECDLRRTSAWTIKNNVILFIDECSMIDRILYREIMDGTMNCKVVYVGDHSQLAPIKEELSPIYKQRLPFFELTQPMRTSNPHLQALNQQMRDTVATGIFKPIVLVPGVIDRYNGDQMDEALTRDFAQQTREFRVMAYTNNRVIQYNDYIRELRGLSGTYKVGELLVSNNATEIKGGEMLSVEEEVEVMHVSPQTYMIEIDKAEDVYLEVLKMDLESNYGYYPEVDVPVDRNHWDALIKYYAKQKDWAKYFHLKKMFADLRPRDACTVHKAQGGTYRRSYIDLADISTCRDPKVVARLLYVAVSRAREHVVFYGELSDKFGGVIG